MPPRLPRAGTIRTAPAQDMPPRPRRRSSTGSTGAPRLNWGSRMPDVVFIVVTVATFALIVLVTKGVERL
ncbi:MULTISPECIES: hypothetical protein [Streptomyces violaceusniger group]|uniref:hypothetical protein n=1 Tax=Streptomyces violaceusniger group TaxID=2839105 RepID=UPI00117C60E1|nr:MULTISPECIES: hypothetical protein [Streptomyces violaceusniger group]